VSSTLWSSSYISLRWASLASSMYRAAPGGAAVDRMVFHTPVHVGDVVSVYADLVSTGRASMKFQVEAWRRSRDGDEQIKVTEPVFTFVSIDSGSRPRPLPLG
jgi:acyl-CoA thioesterase YciA